MRYVVDDDLSSHSDYLCHSDEETQNKQKTKKGLLRFKSRSIEEDPRLDMLGKRILIVDDQSFNRDAMKIILQSALKIDTDKLCSYASNGKEALKKVQTATELLGKCSFDLILMDCNMPHMDGYEATQRIREYLYSKGLDQPIISAVTGHTEKMYVQRAIESGMNQVLSKPVNHTRLRELLDKLGL